MTIDHIALFKRLAADETGAGAIEYALLAALVAVIIVGALVAVGQSGVSLYQSICRGINAAVNTGGC